MEDNAGNTGPVFLAFPVLAGAFSRRAISPGVTTFTRLAFGAGATRGAGARGAISGAGAG